MEFAQHVLNIIRAVPPGQVVTYGQVAALAGYPRRARHVGHPPQRQLELLRAEGVVTLTQRVSLKKYQWLPGPLSFL